MNPQHNKAAGVHAGNEWEMDNYVIEERSTISRTATSTSGVSNAYSTNSYTPFLNHDRAPEPSADTPLASLISNHDRPGVTQQQNISLSAHKQPARTYWFRASIGVLGPLIVLVYLIIIWRCYLSPADSTSHTAFGPRGANWVFYSWFVAGVIGLGLSRYGLAGTEAGMITHPRWKVKSRMQLMLHADGTWSRPSGWIEAGRWMTRMRWHRGSLNGSPGWLWTVLAVPTFIVLIAWLLSALCVEMASGFHHGVQGGAEVKGFVYADFNASPNGRKPRREAHFLGQVPGIGTVYTPENIDRSKKNFLRAIPATLPEDEGVEEIFITAQSEIPIEGKAWGLLIHYDCSVVKRRADLHLLNDRRPANEVWDMGYNVAPDIMPAQPGLAKRQTQVLYPTPSRLKKPTPTRLNKPKPTPSKKLPLPPSSVPTPQPEDDQGEPDLICQGPGVQFGGGGPRKYRSYRLHENATLVELRKMPRARWDGATDGNEDGPLNIDAVIETAYESWPIPTTKHAANPCIPCIIANNNARPDNSASPDCYYDADTTKNDSYPGIDRKRIFEVLLWQGIHRQALWGRPTFDTSLYNLTIDHNITDFYGAYRGINTGPEPQQVFETEGLTAIGVSCTSSSSVGTANIDGVRSTYSDFISTDSPIPSQKRECARRFGAETLACTLDVYSAGVLSFLFQSSGAPTSVDQDDPDYLPGNEHWRENIQMGYMQATQLRTSLLRAFGNYAIRLMYNSGQDFVGADGSHIMTTNPNVTAFVPGKVITPGILPAGVPIALFVCWALISSLLCVLYGFGKRRSAILDTETVLKLGVELEIPGFEESLGHNSAL